MIAVFYGGELVWRERDRKLNEILDSTPVQSWIMTVPKIIAIFIVLLVVNVAAMATGLFYQLVDGAREVGVWNYVAWFIVPAAIDALLIAILSVTVQVLSPNKYLGWGIVFVWFVGTIFLSNMGYNNPLYTYAASPNVPLSDFAGQGSFWKGAAMLRLYWALFAVVLAVIAHSCGRAAPMSGCACASSECAQSARRAPLALAGVAAAGMAATGAYAYYNIKVLNRYQTSDEVEKHTARL